MQLRIFGPEEDVVAVSRCVVPEKFVEIAPVPPGLLTITIFLPSTTSACGWTARDTTSIAPPAPHMMVPVMSRSG